MQQGDRPIGFGLGLVMGSVVLFAAPVLAHTVKTAGQVAATFHLEPSHNPRAGEPAQVWFALTQAGGTVIPLQQCDCQLQVVQAGQVIAQPPLRAIAAEQYQGIPAASITFPQVGIYQLVLQGTAKGGQTFAPFTLSYEVTVQPGTAPPTATPGESSPSASHTSPAATTDPVSLAWIAAGAIGLVGAGGLIWWRRRAAQQQDARGDRND
jgi:hypothetical protein